MFLSFYSCKKQDDKILNDPPINLSDNEVLVLFSEDNEHPGQIQIYNPIKNSMENLEFTLGLGIKKILKDNADFYTATDSLFLKFNSDFSELDPLFEISPFSDVKLKDGALYFVPNEENKIIAKNLSDGALINEFYLSSEPIDYEIFEDYLYVLLSDTLLKISLETTEVTNYFEFQGVGKAFEIGNKQRIWALVNNDNHDFLFQMDLVNLFLTKFTQFGEGNVIRNFTINNRINTLTFISNQTHFYHRSTIEEIDIYIFLDQHFSRITSHIYLPNKNDFIFVDDNYGTEPGKIYHFGFHGSYFNEIVISYNPIQLVPVD